MQESLNQKNAAVKIKQKFLEVANLTQNIHCTKSIRARIYKKDIFNTFYCKDYAQHWIELMFIIGSL